MPFVVLFDDDPSADPDIRQRHMADHLRFLAQHAGAILAAGPLCPSAGAATGGLWVVEAATPDDVEALIHSDPFWPTGLRHRHHILHWTQVFANGAPVAQPG